jgi:peptidoglycan/xylan/chitin deacetylase (PgdA/CDA1 family)
LCFSAPILIENGFKATFFVLTGRFGQRNYLSEANVRDLVAMGMSIGLHGRDHVDWRRCDDSRFEQEVPSARRHLERVAECPIRCASIPFGAYNRTVMAGLRREGFASIFTSDGGRAPVDAVVRARTSLRSDMSEAQVDAILRGQESLHTRLRRSLSMAVRRWIV